MKMDGEADGSAEAVPPTIEVKASAQPKAIISRNELPIITAFPAVERKA
jgi:hypothetical protein